MNRGQARDAILRVLTDVAPDVDPSGVDPAESFREQFELDSIDHLNFVVGLTRAFGFEIPEKDYPRLETLEGCLDYLHDRRNPSTPSV
jgi:acyl carrier protein